MNLCGTVFRTAAGVPLSDHAIKLIYATLQSPEKKTDQTGSNPTTHQISEPLPIAGTRSWEPGPGVPGMLGEYSPQRRGEERRGGEKRLERRAPPRLAMLPSSRPSASRHARLLGKTLGRKWRGRVLLSPFQEFPFDLIDRIFGKHFGR